MLRILVSGGGGLTGHTLIKELSLIPGLEIFVTDINTDNITSHFVNGFFKVSPVKKEKEFLADITRICLDYKIDIIFPATPYDIPILAKHKTKFENKGIYIASSNLTAVDIFNVKQKMYTFFDKHNIPVLKPINPETYSYKTPIIGKPNIDWGSKNIFIANSLEEYKLLKYRNIKDYVWQRYLTNFREISIDFAIDFNSNISQPIFRERLLTSGGIAVIMSYYKNNTLTTLFKKASKLLAKNGAKGIINMQVLIHNRNIYFSDVNLRVGTSAILGSVYNNNLCSFIIASYWNNKQKPNEDKTSPIFPNFKKTYSNSQKVKAVRYLDEKYIPELDLKNVTTIVFDLDETIISQKKWIYDRLTIFRAKANVNNPDFMLHAMQYVDEGKADRLFDMLSQKFGWRNSLKKSYIHLYQDSIPDKCFLFSDVISSLNYLRKKYKLVLFTDNPIASQEKKINMLQIKNFFSTIFFSDIYKSEKPDKKLFINLSKQINVLPSEMIMVGDNLYRDVHGALEADYGHAFFLNRTSSSCAFNKEIFSKISQNDNWTEINSLSELSWFI